VVGSSVLNSPLAVLLWSGLAEKSNIKKQNAKIQIKIQNITEKGKAGRMRLRTAHFFAILTKTQD